MTLRGKKIILGITGSIAAYKSTFLLRELIKQGADVQVIITESASSFVTPLTLATLSKRPALSTFWVKETGEWHNHVQLALWADLIIIAPATANSIAKLANGISDNLLLTVIYSARCALIIAPAMDADMVVHPTLLSNTAKLKSFGYKILQTNKGELASGLLGDGRMAEPEEILQNVIEFFNQNADFEGKKVLITAGPTREAIDPVRYISNHSTGKMGYALAESFLKRGAEVILVSGPVLLQLTHPKLTIHKVESAAEMLYQSQLFVNDAEIVVFTAAVADYRAKEISDIKIKKQDASTELALHLIQNPDIAKTLAASKKENQLMIGFALETNDELENAKKKLISKNLDLVVLNSQNETGAGFGGDTNKVTLVYKNGTDEVPLMTKKDVANEILNFIIKHFN